MVRVPYCVLNLLFLSAGANAGTAIHAALAKARRLPVLSGNVHVCLLEVMLSVRLNALAVCIAQLLELTSKRHSDVIGNTSLHLAHAHTHGLDVKDGDVDATHALQYHGTAHFFVLQSMRFLQDDHQYVAPRWLHISTLGWPSRILQSDFPDNIHGNLHNGFANDTH